MHRKKDNNLILIQASIDRITNEEIPFLIDKMLQTGAKNANLVSAIGKFGRPVYIAYIDFPKYVYTEIIEVLVTQYLCTGWYILSSEHEYVVTKKKEIDVDYKIKNRTKNFRLLIKIIECPIADPLILLEHSECMNIYKTEIITFEPKKSFYIFKTELLILVKEKLKNIRLMAKEKEFISRKGLN